MFHYLVEESDVVDDGESVYKDDDDVQAIVFLVS